MLKGYVRKLFYEERVALGRQNKAGLKRDLKTKRSINHEHSKYFDQMYWSFGSWVL